jgi:hypothetical protein
MQVPQTNALESISKIEKSFQPLAPAAIERARSIASLVERGEFPTPFVFPTEIGGIQFEWKGGERQLNLEVLPEHQCLAFLTIVDGSPVREGEIRDNIEREVYSLLNWMISR